MYRCKVCNSVSVRGQAQRRHIVYRPNGQIAMEVPICSSCEEGLKNGESIAALRRKASPAPSPKGDLEAAVLSEPEEVKIPKPIFLGRPVTVE